MVRKILKPQKDGVTYVKVVSKIFGSGCGCSHAVERTLPANAAAEKFTDVKPGKWYYTAVDYAVSEKLFSGTSSTTFSPEEPMTRGMFVTVLGNKAKIDPKDYPTSSFSDVKPGYGTPPMWSGPRRTAL